MLSKPQDQGTRKQLTVMEKNASRLLDLINQLLDLSKIESGSMKLQVSKADIITVLKGVTLSFHSIIEQKQIELVINVYPEKLEINFDQPKFETILTNLLANAFKFTPERGRIIVESKIIKRSTKKLQREFLEITVADTGSGIPEKDLANIFNRFYQSDNNQLLQQEGSGIGLALSKELVELHGGSIYPFSRLGEGTKIVFNIPVDIPNSDTVSDVPLTAKRYQPIDIRTEENGWETAGNDDIKLLDTKPVVLVVEDHPEVHHYIHEILKEKYFVLSAKDGEEGIMKAIDAIPDLIISDVMMPKKDGYEVSRTLKGDERTSHIPIILLTAKAGSEDKIGGLKTQADDYVTKPFIPDELLARVENLIESRKRLREKYKKESILKPAEIAENSIDEKFLNKLIEIVENQIGNEHFGVEQLSEEIGMSRSQLHRKLKALLDQGPNQFIRTFRLNRALDLLKQHAATTSEIAYRVGFSSPSYFTKCFQEHFGYVPSEVHKNPSIS
jgi:DNA-binding response OmpR family regulator